MILCLTLLDVSFMFLHDLRFLLLTKHYLLMYRMPLIFSYILIHSLMACCGA